MPPQTPDEPVQAPADVVADRPPATPPPGFPGWRPQRPPQLPYELLELVWANLVAQEGAGRRERMRQQARLDFEHQALGNRRPRLTADERLAETRVVRRTRMPVYAAVARWWQEFFEQYTFRALTVTQEVDSGGGGSDGDVEVLYRAIVRDGGRNQHRLGCIKTLRLHIAIAAYDCPECKEPEPRKTIRRNNKAFTRALWIVLLALSPGQRPAKGGMTLELSAASPSDGVHWYKAFELGPEYPYRTMDDVKEERIADDEDREARGARLWLYRKGEGLEDPNDVYHDPDHVVGMETPPAGVARRVMGTQPLTLALELLTDADTAPYADAIRNSGLALRVASMVTNFYLRRQFRRLFDADTIQWLVTRCLPNLHLVRLELWEPMNERQARDMYDAYAKMLAEDLPESVTGLHLTCNHLREEWLHFADAEAMRRLAAALIEASKRVQHVSSMLLVDACFFFSPDISALTQKLENPQLLYQPPPIWWQELQTLSMTAHVLLDPLMEVKYVRRFLRAVAAAVARMPRLLELELWNTVGGSFGMVRLVRPPLATVRIPQGGGGTTVIHPHGGGTGNIGGSISTLDHEWREKGYRPQPATVHLMATRPEPAWLDKDWDWTAWMHAVREQDALAMQAVLEQDTQAMQPLAGKMRRRTVRVMRSRFQPLPHPMSPPTLVLHPLTLQQNVWK